MKQFILLYTIFICTFSVAQNKADSVSVVKVPKPARIILVKHISFESITSELNKQGFIIDEKVDNQIVKTKYKPLRGSLYQIKLTILYADSTARITGTIYKGYNSSGIREAAVTGNSLLAKKPFVAMNNFALALEGEISYEE